MTLATEQTNRKQTVNITKKILAVIAIIGILLLATIIVHPQQISTQINQRQEISEVHHSINLSQINWEKIDLSGVDWDEIDLSQKHVVTVNNEVVIDSSQINWEKIDLSGVDWDKVSREISQYSEDEIIDMLKTVNDIDWENIDWKKELDSKPSSQQINSFDLFFSMPMAYAFPVGPAVVIVIIFISPYLGGPSPSPPPPPPSPPSPPSPGPSGSPLAFTLDPHDKIEHTAIWPDQCKLWNTEYSPNKDKLWIFDAYHSEKVCMNIKIEGGYVLFIDFNDNDVIDGCVELLCNFYKVDQRLTTYQILDNELTNANDDEWFSTMDPLFNKAKAWKPSENTIHTMDELNIIGFHIRDYWMVQDDYVSIGQYADCIYVQNDEYWEAIQSGWECKQLAMHHMRIVAFDSHGVALKDGSFLPSYDFVFGYWTPAQVATVEIVDSAAK